MKNDRQRIFVDRYKNILIAAFVMLLVLVLFCMNQKDFGTRYGFQSIFNQIITLCIAGLGQTLIILTSGIDLSVGNLIILTDCLAATFMEPIMAAVGNDELGCAITMILVILFSAFCGFLNGAIVVYGRLQPIIATLVTGSIFSGVALYVRPSPGGSVLTSWSRKMTGFLIGPIPTTAVILLLLVVVIWLPFRSSRSGQALYAIGGNEQAAYLSGIKIDRAKLNAYILAGVCSGLCGLMLAAQTRSGDPTAQNSYTNNSIAAAALGGAALAGGVGSFYGTICGAVILSLIVGLLIFWGISSYYQSMIQGLILILALSVNVVAAAVRKAMAAKAARQEVEG